MPPRNEWKEDRWRFFIFSMNNPDDDKQRTFGVRFFIFRAFISSRLPLKPPFRRSLPRSFADFNSPITGPYMYGKLFRLCFIIIIYDKARRKSEVILDGKETIQLQMMQISQPGYIKKLIRGYL